MADNRVKPVATLAAESGAPTGEQKARAQGQLFTALLRGGLLPLIEQIAGEAGTLASPGRRGGVAERAEQISTLAAEALAGGEALAEIAALALDEQPLELTTLDLGDVLMALLARWKTRAPLHAFELALPGELPLVAADARRVETALTLLLEAAVRWTTPGESIRVSLRAEQDAVVVSLHPHVGTAWRFPEGEDELFASGFTPTGIRGGALHGGLGLALARAIAEAHGGGAWAEPAGGGAGVMLRARWPLVAGAASPREGQRQEAERPAEVAPPPPSAAAIARHARPTTLIYEPDTRLARYLRANLEARQLRPILATSAAEVSRLIELEEPDVLLLDEEAEGGAGALLERARRLTSAPVLLLARAYDAEACARLLDAGASDYLAKPVHIDELLARLRAALRRAAPEHVGASNEPIFRSGELEVDFAQRRVAVGACEVALSKTEFKLLRALAQHAGAVLSHDMLLERVWGASYRQETEFVWVYVRRLRRKLEPDPKHPRYVLTVPGVGYRLAKL